MPFIWTLPVKGKHLFIKTSQKRPAARTGGTFGAPKKANLFGVVEWARPDGKREFVIGLKEECLHSSYVLISLVYELVSLLFPCFSAFRASYRIVFKPFFLVKILFFVGEHKLGIAVFAD
jgi:hypothetical protein